MSGSQSTASSSTVTPGNWITQTINGMQYDVLLPANYDPSIKYPTVLYLHQLDMGDYPAGLLAEANPWFNTTTFRTDYPSIVVMPLLDQTADPSGSTINFGGVSTADTAGEDNAIAALQQVMSQYSSDPSRVYVTGNSMGGIGTEDMVIKYNAYTGTEGKIFAAALSLAGADYGQGYPMPNASVVSALKNVPFWAIHGGQDTTVPLAWDQNLYAAEQAIGGDMKYTQDNTLGHDVWDTYYTQDGAGSPLGWLFSQSTGGSTTTPNPPPVPNATASANDTVITGITGSIIDASSNKWTINAAGQVAVNGTADATTANVIELAYVNGTIWQENSSKLWWGETQPNAAWSPAAGTAISPLPALPAPSANDTVVTGVSGAIIDTGGNKWTINAAGQVAVNGTADATTANVIELAYVSGTIWQENSSKLWWGEMQPGASWSPAAGMATSPLPVPPASSANDTVVKGTTGAITDAGGNKWTINAAGQVAVNGTADATTANVIELAYVNGTIWQENSSKLWWGETQPNAAWSPAAGTATSPLPPPPPTASANDTMVLAGASTAITDASGNKWTINAAGQVAVNGTADATTANVIELAYVNGTIWQENSSKLWWGETQPNAAWSPAAGTATSPLPPSPPTASANDTMVLAGASTAITDASGNKWTINAAGQVAVNGTADATTANVTELAYVNKAVWQENASMLWWGKTSPTATWTPGMGTSTSPLPAPIAISASDTVTASQISVLSTSGAHMLFLKGSGDIVNLSGGANTITDTGRGNTYILPTAGKGTDSFTGNILNLGDTVDLKSALAATNWNGAAATLSQYLTVADSTKGATLSIAATSGGAGAAIATINGATTLNLSGLLAHAIT